MVNSSTEDLRTQNGGREMNTNK